MSSATQEPSQFTTRLTQVERDSIRRQGRSARALDAEQLVAGEMRRREQVVSGRCRFQR